MKNICCRQVMKETPEASSKGWNFDTLYQQATYLDCHRHQTHLVRDSLRPFYYTEKEYWRSRKC